MRVAELESKAERDFVRAVIETGDATLAGRIAGLARPDSIVLRPDISAAIWAGVCARLVVAAPVALSVLERLMTDKDAPAHVRRLAASDILERAGYVRKSSDSSDSVLGVADMTPSALRALIGRLESELSDKAKPVAVAVVEHDAQPVAVASDKPLSVLD